MTPMRIALAGALILAGMGVASAQTVIVEPGYGPPAYVVAPAPVYPVPAPAYVAPAPTYVAPVRPWHRHVVIESRPAWDAAPGVVYSDW